MDKATATPPTSRPAAAPPPTSRPRTAARVGAVQALFQAEQGGESPEAVIDQFVRHRLGEIPGREPGQGGGFEDGRVPDAHVKLFGRIVREAVLKQDQLDRLLTESLPAEWPLGRLDPVLRALLRAAGAELTMRDGPPVAVVINEYMDVAHGFFHGEEPKMANGLMDRMAHTLRPARVRGSAVGLDAACPRASWRPSSRSSPS